MIAQGEKPMADNADLINALLGNRTLADYGIRDPNPPDNDLAYYLRSRAATKRDAAETLMGPGAIISGLGLGAAKVAPGPIGKIVGGTVGLAGGALAAAGLQKSKDAERYNEGAYRWRTLGLPYRIGIEE